MIERRFGITPRRLIGDTAYGTAHMLGWLVEEKHIAPHVPVWDKTERTDGTFSRSDFQWDEQRNEYRCPGHCTPGSATSRSCRPSSRKATASTTARASSTALPAR